MDTIRVKFFLKGGSSFEMRHLVNFKVRKNAGNVEHIDWTCSPQTKEKVLHLEVSEIAAILVEDEE